jgi:hypothetical protein
MLRRWLLLPGLASALVACGSDAPEPPNPSLRDPGTFVAVDEGKGHLTLYRSIDTFAIEDDVTLFVRTYDVTPRTLDDALALAKHGPLPVLYPTVAVALENFPSGPYWILWFRTLTEAEIALSR